MQVIPAVNCLDFDCVKDLVRQASGFLPPGGWIHLDVADARFTFNKTWGDPAKWHEVRSGLNLEVHLMVEEPERLAPLWLEAGAKRIIVHVETVTPESALKLRDMARSRGAEFVLSSNSETPIEALEPYLDSFSFFQVLAVHPGLAGQAFLSSVLEKIKFIRAKAPQAVIEVDGGINPQTAALAKAAGANTVVSASFIFGRSDAGKAYAELTSA